MKRKLTAFLWCVLSALAGAASLPAEAPRAAATVPVVMLSDIHFDPFHDPAKLAELRAKPASEWAAVLSAPDTPAQAADYAALQKPCPVRGVDTPWPLLQASMAAVQAQQPKPLFVTVSGDLMAHGFDCRFRKLAPSTTEAEYSEFAAKTVEFVALQLRETFPGVAVYLALGNNDSGCTDYQEAGGSAFLTSVGQSFAGDVADAAGRSAVLREFAADGDYSVMLPQPMQRTRLIVLQDIFESARYKSCGGGDAKAGAKAQLAWLHEQLAAAHAHHEHVWVMAHIPPGVDVYSTLVSAKRNVCGGQPPVMFLSSEKLAEEVTEYPDTVTLALFAHTHMDEMRLLHGSFGTAGVRVPAKLVPSITPVNGNNPAFTVARVRPQTAEMVDYTVYASSDAAGSSWSKEYTYSTTYGEPDFSAQSVQNLTIGFNADKAGTAAKSQAYGQYFFVGDSGMRRMAMMLGWPAYSCSLRENTEGGYRNCLCGGPPLPAAK